MERLAEDAPTLVGIDHGFSFPLRYFEAHGLLPDWPHFLDDFQRHWPTDADHSYVEFVRNGINGNGAARLGNARWRRLTVERAGGAKSVFHFKTKAGHCQINRPAREKRWRSRAVTFVFAPVAIARGRYSSGVSKVEHARFSWA